MSQIVGKSARSADQTQRGEDEDLLMLELLGGRNLLVMDKNDKSDPFVITRILNRTEEEEKISSRLLHGDQSGLVKKNLYRSSICFQTLSPVWNESYSLWINRKQADDLVLRFDVYDWDRIGRDYMGKACVPVSTLLGHTSPTMVTLPIDVEGVKQRKKSVREEGGTIEVQVVVVPTKNLERHYLVAEKHLNGLVDLFFRRPGSVALTAMVAYSETSDEMASAVCDLAEYASKLREVLTEILVVTVKNTNQESTLFRTNSTATKAIRMTLTVQGQSFLQSVLGPLVAEVLRDPVGYELNASRLPEEDKDNAIMHFKLRPDVGDEELKKHVLELNCAKMHSMCMRFVREIRNGVEVLPELLKDLLYDIRSVVERVFPDSALLAVGGFFFLRFVVPAIATPEHFAVVPDHTSPITAPQRRALTLISKIIQNMANGTEFGSKEGFMTQANHTIEQGTPVVNECMQIASTRSSPSSSPSRTAQLDRVANMSFRQLRQIKGLEITPAQGTTTWAKAASASTEEQVDSMAHLITRFETPDCRKLLQSSFPADSVEAKLLETIQIRLRTALEHAEEDTNALIQSMTSRGTGSSSVSKQPQLGAERKENRGKRVTASKSSLAYDARVVPQALSQLQQSKAISSSVWTASDKPGNDYVELKGSKFEHTIHGLTAGEYSLKFRLVPVISTNVRHVIFDIRFVSTDGKTLYHFSGKKFLKDEEEDVVLCINNHDAPAAMYFSAQQSMGLVNMKFRAALCRLAEAPTRTPPPFTHGASRTTLLGSHKTEDSSGSDAGGNDLSPVRVAAGRRSPMSAVSPTPNVVVSNAGSSSSSSSSSGGGERNTMPIFIALLSAGIPEDRAKEYVNLLPNKNISINEYITSDELLRDTKILIGDKAKIRKYVRLSGYD